MAMKWEFGALGAVVLAASVFMLLAEPINGTPPLGRVDNFSKLDYDAFDRDFSADGEMCAVGLARQKLCFSESPLEKRIAMGEALEQNIPILVAEFPILVATPPKAAHQKLLRYGTTLVLINKDTQIVEDMLDLRGIAPSAHQHA